MDESGILRFKQLFDLVKPNPFEAIYAANTSILEFTINYPRKSKSFHSLAKEAQKLLYMSLLRKVLEGLTFKHKEPVIRFEECKSGDVHMHGYIELEGKYYMEGVVSEFARQTLKSIDGRLRYDRGEFYHKFCRYRSPCICCQITDRVSDWEKYINKDKDT